MRRFRRLLVYLRPFQIAFAAAMTAAVVASVLDGFTFVLLIPFLRLLFGKGTALASAPTPVERVLRVVTGPLLTHGGAGQALMAVVILIVAAMVLKNAAAYAGSYLTIAVQEGVARDLRVALYAHIQRLGLPFFQRTRGGQLIARVLSDADQARLGVSQALASALRNLTLVAVYVIILIALSWRLALVTLLLAPAIAMTMRPILRRIRRRARAMADARGDLAAVMGETLAGARLVKAHAAEAYERHRFGVVADGVRRAVLRTERWALLASPLSESFGAIVVVILLTVGVRAASGGTIRPELFLVFLAITLRLLPPVKALTQFPTVAEEALAGAQRIFDVLDRVPDDVDEVGARTFPGLTGEIRFRDVWVAHEPNQWVLRGADLTIHRGEVVALVGPSGAGKSTLADLLLRFVEPAPGRGGVFVDGTPLGAYDRRSLRRAIGIVSQETVIFNDTVRANIAYGDQAGATREAVEAAARAANAHTFIEGLPRGYETPLGERGTRLSGGERQRIALARVLLRDPPILILDEATSALDPESERLVQEAIGRLLAHRTVLVIAHRLATVARADRIYVLDGGRIVEAGTHGELVRAGGLYERLHHVELAGRVP